MDTRDAKRGGNPTGSRAERGSARRLVCGATLAILAATGCNFFGRTPPTTDAYGKATHTGTLYLLRVDDAWNPAGERGVYRIGSEDLGRRSARFAPLRGRTDVAGLDGHDRIVTRDDFVTVTLKSAFLKYFRESGGDERRGEIAVVMSFEAGSAFRNSFLVYGSQNQTLASLLSLDNWPVIGPIRIDGDSLKLRVVVIELDKAENEAAAGLVREVAKIAASAQPQYAPAMQIVADVADALIRLNQDDVVLDQRFALQRVTPGAAADRNPLLYGTYVLMLQEDRLSGSGAEKYDARSALPPRVDRLRYDTWHQRVFMTFNYLPRPPDAVFAAPDTRQVRAGAPVDDAVAGTPPVGAAAPDAAAEAGSPYCPEYDPDQPTIRRTFRGSDHLRDTGGWFRTANGPTPELEEELFRERCLLSWVNAGTPMRARQLELGYENARLSDLDVFPSYSEAMTQVYRALIRGEAPQRQRPGPEADGGVPELLEFEFPVVEHNGAFTILAQYPLHTHLVMSIDRSLGGDGEAAHARFQGYTDFLEAEIASARDGNVATRLAEQLRRVGQARRRQAALFERVAGLPEADADRKACELASALPGPDADEAGFFSDAALYNEIFHASGRVWSSREEAVAYFASKPCSLGDCDGCTVSSDG